MAFDTSHIQNLPEGLDPEIVKKTHRGKGWGAQDQARYDAEIGTRMKGSDVKNAGANRQEKLANMDQHIKDGGYLGGVAQRKYDRMEAKERAGNFKAYTSIPNNQQQNVNQDNDQSSNVTGDNNYVYQNQDNSIRNYGGDNRSFVYNSNGGEGPDTPATMATLAGYYAPDDSHAAQAARLDRNVTMNRDNQKKYANTSYIAQGAIKRAEQNSYIDPKALDQRIAARSQYHKDQATIRGAGIFGDIYGLEGPTWKSSKPAEEVEKPDFKKMYDTYTDF